MIKNIKKMISVYVIVALVLTIASPLTTSPVFAKDNTYKKVIISEPFNFDTFSSKWKVLGNGWVLTTSPTDPAAPLRSPCIAKFKSYDLDEGKFSSLVMKDSIDLSKAISVEFDFYMYHDVDDDSEDTISPAFYNGKTVRYSKKGVYRYDGSAGWKRHIIECPVSGEYFLDSLSPGLRGYSDYGNNIYIDSLTITAKCSDSIPPTKPNMKLSNKKITNKNVKVTIVNGVDNESGVSHSEYKIGVKGAWGTYTKPFSVSKNATVYARTKDNVGLTSNETKITIKNIDKTPPKITAKSNKKKIKNKSKVKRSSVIITVKDTNLKSKTVTKNAKKIKWSKKSKFTSKGKYVITAKDKAGNKSKFAFTIK